MPLFSDIAIHFTPLTGGHGDEWRSKTSMFRSRPYPSMQRPNKCCFLPLGMFSDSVSLSFLGAVGGMSYHKQVDKQQPTHSVCFSSGLQASALLRFLWTVIKTHSPNEPFPLQVASDCHGYNLLRETRESTTHLTNSFWIQSL